MEWAVLALLVLAAAAFIAPALRESGREGPGPQEAARRAREERRRLLEQLRSIDADFAAGRVSGEQRLERRRALGPRLLATYRNPGAGASAPEGEP
ncbi:MAG: hypothetical protein OXC94_04440 [Chloroflexi bacterium]|nr:hypothetical protein [Chloroflexota bacterium]